MGVPKFYKWISERYPCLSEVVREEQIPNFDCLYLDMNGIIHKCAHPDDDDAHFRITEEQIFADIDTYISTLFRIIKPRRVFFMAVDGVAPRAKMNQQRARRFMSARNAEETNRKAREAGEELPTEARFDNNSITPGTHFMARLNTHLQYFVARMIHTDEQWRNVDVWLSGHDVPGEGEHKIMEFIRHERASKNYDPYTRHCLYGLDADLIMLGLCSHEPNFSLLREEINFNRMSSKKYKANKKQGTANAQETVFHLLHLSLMREYLDFEFSPLKTKLPFAYDLESLIDDWVLMGFLVGNDFIPHLPHMHINEDALPFLYNTYIAILPQLEGYINEHGTLNVQRFAKFIAKLADFDKQKFESTMEDNQWLKSKRQQINYSNNDADDEVEEITNRNNYDSKTIDNDKQENIEAEEKKNSPPQTINSDEEKTQGAFDSSSEDDESTDITDDERSDAEPKKESHGILSASMALEKGLASLDMINDDDDDEDGFVNPAADGVLLPITPKWTKVMKRQFKDHKRTYYKDKMDYNNITKEQLKEQAVGYIRAIQWNLHYYYHGCASWSWFYPHHYAPYLSDIAMYAHEFEPDFDLSQPFLPFQQLLAVLPAASRHCLPEPYQELMVSPTSPIIDLYPTEFVTDLNGKVQEWEAVVLIPFINEQRLLEAIEPKNARLTEEEKRRNKHGEHKLYQYDKSGLLNDYQSPDKGQSNIIGSYVQCRTVSREELVTPRHLVRYGLMNGYEINVYSLGFPTFRHLPHIAYLSQAAIKVFNFASKKDSMLVKINNKQNDEKRTIESLAGQLIRRKVYINWPYLKAAIVVGVTSEHEQAMANESDSVEEFIPSTSANVAYLHQINQQKQKDEWCKEKNFIVDRLETRYGLHMASEINILLNIRRHIGSIIKIDKETQYVHRQHKWSEVIETVPYDTTLPTLNIHDSTETNDSQTPSLRMLFAKNSRVFFINTKVNEKRKYWYGCQGAVVDIRSKSDDERKRVELTLLVPYEPHFGRIIDNLRNLSLHWMPTSDAAFYLHLYPKVVARITGSLFIYECEDITEIAHVNQSAHSRNKNRVELNKIQAGLQLKFNKRREEVCEYSRKDLNTNDWLFSTYTVELINDYHNQFRQLFNSPFLHNNLDEPIAAGDVWPSEDGFDWKQECKRLRQFLNSLPSMQANKHAFGSEILDSATIKYVEKEVEKVKLKKTEKKEILVLPSCLYMPSMSSGEVYQPDETNVKYELFDRVVNLRHGYTVPVGLRGTVVGIYNNYSTSACQLDVIFDEDFVGGQKLRVHLMRNNGYRVPASAMLNLSLVHGRYTNVVNEQQTSSRYQSKQVTQVKVETKEKDNKQDLNVKKMQSNEAKVKAPMKEIKVLQRSDVQRSQKSSEKETVPKMRTAVPISSLVEARPILDTIPNILPSLAQRPFQATDIPIIPSAIINSQTMSSNNDIVPPDPSQLPSNPLIMFNSAHQCVDMRQEDQSAYGINPLLTNVYDEQSSSMMHAQTTYSACESTTSDPTRSFMQQMTAHEYNFVVSPEHRFIPIYSPYTVSNPAPYQASFFHQPYRPRYVLNYSGYDPSTPSQNLFVPLQAIRHRQQSTYCLRSPLHSPPR